MPRSQHPCFVVTCEHGGNSVPRAYARLFEGKARALLKTHRGYDAGALQLAVDMAQALGAPLFACRTTRLLVDLNRSIGHPALFSKVSARASAAVRKAILERHYFPFRDAVEAFIGNAVARGRSVVHISSHSFTPVLNGRVRNADLGLLYDPRRGGERLLCRNWQRAVQGRDSPSDLKVRLNYPYRGTADGFTVHLRRRFGAASYLGIELEINQRHTLPPRHWTAFRRRVVAALLASSTGR